MLPLAQEMNIGILARVPLDEGALSGTITENTTFPPGDFREYYFRGAIARSRSSSMSTRCAATWATAPTCPTPHSASASRTRPFPR